MITHHLQDLRSVYGKRLSLDDRFDPSEARIRTSHPPLRHFQQLTLHVGVTNNVITSQVASGLLRGLFPKSDHIQVQIQAPPFDSLEPGYPCSNANNLRNGYQTGSKGQVWQDHLTAAATLYEKLDSVSGIAKDDGGWHMSFDQ